MAGTKRGHQTALQTARSAVDTFLWNWFSAAFVLSGFEQKENAHEIKANSKFSVTNYMKLSIIPHTRRRTYAARKFSFILLDQYAKSNPFTVIHSLWFSIFLILALHTWTTCTRARERAELIKSSTQTAHFTFTIDCTVELLCKSNLIESFPLRIKPFDVFSRRFRLEQAVISAFFYRFSSLEPFCKPASKLTRESIFPE